MNELTALSVDKTIAPIVPQDMGQIREVALAIFNAGMVPDGTKGKTEAETLDRVAIVIQKGLEVGFPPLQALSWITVINGRAALWGDALPALVHASGVCAWVEEVFEGEPGTDERRAVCRTKRRDQEKVFEYSFSAAQAKRAKLLTKPGTWMLYPDRMMQLRARAFCFRDAYADILGGLRIAEEERDISIKDITPADTSFLDEGEDHGTTEGQTAIGGTPGSDLEGAQGEGQENGNEAGDGGRDEETL